MDQNPTSESKTLLDLSRKAKYSRSCKACGVTIYFVEQASGKLLPFTYDGKPHWVNCTKPEQFRKADIKPVKPVFNLKAKPPKAEQGTLFDLGTEKKGKGYPD